MLAPRICIVYFKRLTESMFYDMLLLKILNVSERTGMSVVPRSSDVFASQKLAFRSVHGCTLLNRLFSKALEGHLSASSIFKRLFSRIYGASRTGMSVVPRSRDVLQKTIRRETKANLLNLLRMNIRAEALLLFADYIPSGWVPTGIFPLPF